MGPDDQLGVPLGHVATDLALAIFFQRAGQEDDPVSGVFQDAARGKIMLLGQDFGGRHERNLESIFHRNDGRFEGHDSLARSDIALQQAAHGDRFFHVGRNFLEHALLRGGGMERQDLLDRFAGTIVQAERDSGLRLLLPPFELEAQLEKEKLFKNQPDVGWSTEGLQVLKAFAGIGPVDLAQRVLRRDQAQVAAYGSRDRVCELRWKFLQNAMNDAAEPARRQAALAGGLVNGDNAADFER